MQAATLLAECAGCSVLVHAHRHRASECPRCKGALSPGGIDVGFHDARAVYGAPGEPWVPAPARTGALLRCADGHKARSREEKLIDDWLTARGIHHEREPTVTCGVPEGAGLKRMRPDWRVGNVYIEFWGMAGQQGYEARREEKLAAYRRKGLKLIELFPEDVDVLDQKLGALAEDPLSRAWF